MKQGRARKTATQKSDGKRKRSSWYLGNTTVRSPFRLRDALVALSASALQGHLHGSEQEQAFCALLGREGIVDLRGDESYSVGRKWRSALGKLGFLYPDLSVATRRDYPLEWPVDTITPNGWRLIRAETVPAMQECFLRALAAYYIPSPIEGDFAFRRFSPLRHVLSVMLELERVCGSSLLQFIEMSLVVQMTSADDDIEGIVARVLELRRRRENADVTKRVFDRQARDLANDEHMHTGSTLFDYADTNLRYLKATGLVHSQGRGISLAQEKYVFIQELAAEVSDAETPPDYFTTLSNGARLPTDNQNSALAVHADLLAQLARRKIPFDLDGRPVDTPADIAIIRHEIEELLSNANEEAFAVSQASLWPEIAAYMRILSKGDGRATLDTGEEISVPRSEAPAYFEWVLWRAFLAINSLVNKPYEARRFRVDQDFLPIGTAPGGGPDAIFEFESFVIALEVTLTTNSRQEAAEGEPVRRHVADLVLHHAKATRKPVFGLFLANKIDSNTAETFRIGVWYSGNDEKMRLDIVPMSLDDFRVFFEAIFSLQKVDAARVRELLERCGDLRASREAPEWKRAINSEVRQYVSELG